MINLIAVSAATGDPLYARGIGTFAHPSLIFITLLKAAIVFAVLLGSAALMSVLHRRLRKADDVAGTSVSAAFATTGAPDRRRLIRIAPYAALLCASLAYAIVPFGDIVHVFGHDTRLQLADPGAGVLVLFAFLSLSLVFMALSSWASGAYETTQRAVEAVVTGLAALVVLVLAVAATVGVVESLQTSAIVEFQQRSLRDGWPDWIHQWNVIATGVVPFLLYFVAAVVLLRVNPVSERVSGVRQSALFFAARINEVVLIALAVALFFGGGDGPTASFLPDAYWSILWFAVKSLVLAVVLLRFWRPRVRLVDRTAASLLKWSLPVAAGWTVASLAWRVRDSYALYVGAAFLVLYLFFALAALAARDRREDAELLSRETAREEVPV